MPWMCLFVCVARYKPCSAVRGQKGWGHLASNALSCCIAAFGSVLFTDKWLKYGFLFFFVNADVPSQKRISGWLGKLVSVSSVFFWLYVIWCYSVYLFFSILTLSVKWKNVASITSFSQQYSNCHVNSKPTVPVIITSPLQSNLETLRHYPHVENALFRCVY